MRGGSAARPFDAAPGPASCCPAGRIGPAGFFVSRSKTTTTSTRAGSSPGADPESVADLRFLRRALVLARRGQGRVTPNPLVGAVVVRNGRVVGEGWHRRFGGAHAEVEALARAGRKARGATIYVTLEPCAHHGKTPPCTDAIRAAGVTRVVAAMRDPNPRVAGGGARKLARAGLGVRVGLLEAEARALNPGFVSAAERGRAHVTLKLAASLDGCVATAGGDSRWITGPLARKEAHRLRAAHDGVVVGGRTVRTDDPELTVRHVRGVDPARIVLDPRLESSPEARWLTRATARRIIVTTRRATAARRLRFAAAGAEVWDAPEDRRGGVSLSWFVRRAASEGVLSLLVEGGGRLAGAFLSAGLVDRLALFTGPLLLGDGRRFSAGLRVPRVEGAPRIRVTRWKRLGDDALVEGDLG